MQRHCTRCNANYPANQHAAHMASHGERRQTQSRWAWSEVRAQILERDGHACQECGSTERLEVHHVDGRWQNNHPSNLITLCFDCHRGPARITRR